MAPPFEGTEVQDLAKAKSIVADLDDKEKKLLLEALNTEEDNSEKLEQKEEIEGLPKLKKENFRVEDLTKWSPTEDKNGVKILENPEKDACEYLEGDYKGEQFFSNAAAIRETENVGETMLEGGLSFRDIVEKKYDGDVSKFIKGENIKLSGIYDEWFYGEGKYFGIWAKRSSITGEKERLSSGNYSYNTRLPVRCIQS